MRRIPGLVPAVLALLLVAHAPGPAGAAPEGQLRWGVHVPLAPPWLDPLSDDSLREPIARRR